MGLKKLLDVSLTNGISAGGINYWLDGEVEDGSQKLFLVNAKTGVAKTLP